MKKRYIAYIQHRTGHYGIYSEMLATQKRNRFRKEEHFPSDNGWDDIITFNGDTSIKHLEGFYSIIVDEHKSLEHFKQKHMSYIIAESLIQTL